MFTEAGFPDAIISGSNDLDEYLIQSLKEQGCTVTSWASARRSSRRTALRPWAASSR